MARSCGLAALLFVACALAFSASPLAADDSIPNQIRALDAESSEARDAAERALAAAGLEAVEPLEKAASTGPLEQRFRAVRVLSQLLRSNDDRVVERTRSALEAAAKQEDRDVARQAEVALNYLLQLDLMRKLAAQFKVQDVAGGQPKEVKLIERPLLRFQDAMRDNADGTLWAYSNGGRPKVVVATFPFSGNVWYSDAVALGDTPIQVKAVDGNAEANWSPSRASEAFREFPQAAKPAETAEQRLAQLNELAGRMAARQDSPKGLKPYDLSLLEMPLLRYSDEAEDVIDGAMFAFVHDSNPEVIVLIEAQGKPGAAVWKYRLARHTSKALAVEIDDEEVWASPAPTDYLQGADRPYWVVRRTLPE